MRNQANFSESKIMPNKRTASCAEAAHCFSFLANRLFLLSGVDSGNLAKDQRFRQIGAFGENRRENRTQRTGPLEAVNHFAQNQNIRH